MKRKGVVALSLLLMAAAVAGFFGVKRFRYRFIRSDADLLRFLPQGDETLFFADVAAMRRAGYLRFLANAQRGQESDYRQFVQLTGFDYTRDLDAVAGAADGERTIFILRGRFDWKNIRQYATNHGGRCDAGFCKTPTSTPGRWASFRPIQPDAIALAVSRSPVAVTEIEQHSAVSAAPSDAPVWIRPAHSILANPTELPLPLRILAISLQSSDSVVLSLRPAEASGVAFSIEVDARCSNASTADTARTQLQLNTDRLKAELARDHKQPNPADLIGLLTAGEFRVADKHVLGFWPVRTQLLASLE